MAYRTSYVSHSKDGEFTLHIVDRSAFRDALRDTAEVLCEKTGHRFEFLLHPILDWSDKSEVQVDTIKIDRTHADAMSHQTDAWSFLDEDEMPTEESDEFLRSLDERIAEYDAKPWYSKFLKHKK